MNKEQIFKELCDDMEKLFSVYKAKLDNEEPEEIKYPTTYEDCVDILEEDDVYNVYATPLSGCYARELGALQKLLVCRDCYWHLYGKSMNNGDWVPDWNDSNTLKYVIIGHGNDIYLTTRLNETCVLAFPTEEMRDVFYENFKNLIDIAKPLL